jgi:hypothetical protein
LKNFSKIFFITFLLSSCASMFRSENEWASISDNSAPHILKQIKNKDMKGALEEFSQGLFFNPEDYAFIYFHDLEGMRRSFNLGKEHSNMAGRFNDLRKTIILMLSELQLCINEGPNELRNCIKSFKARRSGYSDNGSIYEFNYDVTNVPKKCEHLSNSEYVKSGGYQTAESKRENCYVVESMISNICNKPLTLYNESNQSASKQDSVQWGGFLFTYAFNSSFSKNWKELEVIRNSNFCM